MRTLTAVVDSLLGAGVHPATLVCIAGPDQGRTLRMGVNGAVLGRDRDCDFKLNAADISARHARLHLRGGRLFLEDLQSAGGIRIEGCPLPRGAVAPIVIGMQFQIGSDTVAIADSGTRLSALEPRPMQALTIRHDRSQYEQKKHLADGRNAVIYQHVRGKTAVVVKILNDASWQQAERRVELAHRVRYLSHIAHQHLVKIEGADSAADRPFVVERFVASQSAADVLAQRKKLAPAELGRWIEQACVAIDALHRAGVTHQMLDNHGVLIDEEGAVRVIMSDALAVPGVALRMGATGALQAPEVQRGEWPVPASDVFSLGALAYHWACGRPPASNDGNPNGKIAPLRQLEPGAPGALESVVMRALIKQPGDRYSSVAAFAQAIARCRL